MNANGLHNKTEREAVSQVAKFMHRATQFSLQTKVFLTFLALLLFVLGCFLVYVNVVVIRLLKEKTVQDM
ncbi:hypothetical protein BZG21_41810, partial [Escherichia coli]|nr:hypothetical protein [Escherichia coli]